MRHRTFIAINFPEDIKKELSSFQKKWPELPIRWTKPENLHITLAFLGYLTDEELVEILRITKEVAQRHQPFSINLNKICYGPPKMPYSETKSLTGRRDKIANRPPRMVWAVGEKSKDLANLQLDLEKSLTSSGKIKFEPEERSFTCHITLARIRQWEFRQIEPEERPDVEENISLSFEVNSIEVMESQLKRGGAEYTILESIPLSKL
jgi:2'-5' RNA ligase